MKTPTRRSLIWLSSAYLAFGMPTNAQTTTAPDLDRDGIANINDPDVDNDGLLNGADRNIDGGTARSGPLKGRYIGDRLNNDNAAEADMDADGLADNSLKETDIDGDGLADSAANETDIDGDGRADDAANEADIDGDGKTDDAPNETDIDGDGLEDDATAEADIDGDNRADNSASESDIDGDGRADDTANETDIDGDGKTDISINETDIDGDNLADDASNEHDVDGDGLDDEALKETDIDGDNLENAADNEADIDGDNIVNDEDPDMDSDGVENEIDEDFDNDGVKDTIDFTDDGGNGSFIDDDSAKPTNDFVSSKLSELLGVANDSRLKVAVMSTTEPYGTWNYRTSDGISVNGVWSYPADKPEELKPFMSNAAGENRIYAQYPNGFLTFYSWLPGEPVGFAFSTLSEQATGKTAPIARLHSYVSGFPNAYPEILPQVISGSTSIMFYGDLPVFDGIGPIVDQQRAIFKIVTDWEKENYPTDRR
ncbi:MAG: MSCRAMM family adhesin SdrC [Verrucomicrobia bacterium]|nr:MSCRAMM family adhesin SdrC [Verrucomicrobiota bacterium]